MKSYVAPRKLALIISSQQQRGSNLMMTTVETKEYPLLSSF